MVADTLDRNNETIKKILVPTDGSQPSDRALHFAVRLARVSKAQVILLYVLKEWWLPMGFSGSDFISLTTGRKISEKKFTRELIQIHKAKAIESLKTQTSCTASLALRSKA